MADLLNMNEPSVPYPTVPAEKIGRYAGAFHAPAQARIGMVTL